MVSELGNVAEVLNITEGPFAFDPALPGAGCSPSTSWQDQHLTGVKRQPPENRDTFISRYTYTHSQSDTALNIIYDSVMKYRFSLTKCTVL